MLPPGGTFVPRANRSCWWDSARDTRTLLHHGNGLRLGLVWRGNRLSAGERSARCLLVLCMTQHRLRSRGRNQRWGWCKGTAARWWLGHSL